MQRIRAKMVCSDRTSFDLPSYRFNIVRRIFRLWSFIVFSWCIVSNSLRNFWQQCIRINYRRWIWKGYSPHHASFKPGFWFQFRFYQAIFWRVWCLSSMQMNFTYVLKFRNKNRQIGYLAFCQLLHDFYGFYPVFYF